MSKPKIQTKGSSLSPKPNDLFRRRCNAQLRGKPGQRCRRSPVAGKRRCALHGGISRGPSFNPDRSKPGPKPRHDPMAAERRKLRSRLLRGGAANLSAADLAAIIPITSPPSAAALSASLKPVKAPTPPVPAMPPPWPSNGYAGTAQARELERAERAFITELAAPLDLDRLLRRAIDRCTPATPASPLLAREVGAALAALVQVMQRHVEERLETFAQAEAMFRPDPDARNQRLARLRFEIDDYLRRLSAGTTVLVLRLEKSERQKRERARAASDAITGRYADLAAARAERQVADWQPHSIAPWRTKR